MAFSNGRVQKNYVSAISPVLDKREIFQGVIDVQRDDQFMSFLEAMDGKPMIVAPDEKTGMSIYYSWYNNPISQMIDTTGATVVGSGTATVVVTVLPAGSQGKLVIGQELRWGAFTAIVTAITSAGFTATSINGGNLTLTAGTFISPFTNAQPEASDAPAAQRFDVGSLQNQTQIIRNTYEFTDVQMRNGVEFEIDGVDSIIPYEAIESSKKHKLEIQGALFMGEISSTQFASASPTLVGPNGLPIQTTRGLTQYVSSFGVQDTVATLGTVVLQDLYDMTTQLNNNRAPRKYVVGSSNSARNPYDSLLKNLGSSGVTSVRMPINGREVDLMVEKVTVSGFELNFFEMGLLSNAQMFGTATAGLLSEAKKSWWIPVGKVNTIKHGLVPYIRRRYSEPAHMGSGTGGNRTIGNNGMTMEIMTGGLAPNATSQTLNAVVTYTTNIGLECFNPQAMGSQAVLA